MTIEHNDTRLIAVHQATAMMPYVIDYVGNGTIEETFEKLAETILKFLEAK